MNRTTSKTYRIKSGQKIYEVNLDDGTGKPHHRDLMDKLIRGEDTEYFNLISALHKEIRRGDISKALVYGNWAAEIRGKSKVKQYVKAIIFEETRNVELWKEWRSVRGWTHEEMIRAIAGSRKKWELPELKGVYPIILQAVRDARHYPMVELDELKGPPTEDEKELYSWMLMLGRIVWRGKCERWRFGAGREYYEQFGQTLGDVLLKHNLEIEAQVVSKNPDFHDLWTGIEAACGLISEFATDVNGHTERPVDYHAIYYPSYVFDGHTKEGRRRLSEARGNISFNEPLPKGVDLRWSGKTQGQSWRYAAFEQYGMHYKLKKWHEVEIPDDRYKMCNEVNAMW